MGGGGMGRSIIYMVIAVAAFVLIVMFAVFRENDRKRSGSGYVQEGSRKRKRRRRRSLRQKKRKKLRKSQSFGRKILISGICIR